MEPEELRLGQGVRRLREGVGYIPFEDEVGYIPFEAEAANLFFQLVSSRYERASVIVTSNKPFGRWGEVFGDATVAAAMIDRLVHHAEVVSLKGDSYRLKDRDLGGCLTTTQRDRIAGRGVSSQPAKRDQFSTGVDTISAPVMRPERHLEAIVCRGQVFDG